MKRLSKGEETLAFQLKLLKIDFEREYEFYSLRGWKADFYLLPHPILVEVEGGTRSGGRHTRHEGFTEDCRKYNQATAMGFKVLRFTTEMVTTGEAIAFIEGVVNGIRACR